MTRRATNATIAGLAAVLVLAGCAPPDDSLERLGRASAEPLPSGGDWPSFRGSHASGVADGQHLPDNWDGESGENVAWRVPLPGLSHASPVIWGDSIFITTAVGESGDDSIRQGIYAEGDASDDRSAHRWEVHALDKRSGETSWVRTIHESVPTDKRHQKATYNNSSPVTDGRYLVVSLGSEGLFAFDTRGEPVWRKSLGRLDAGDYAAPKYEFGSGSSPIIWGDLVIVQADHQGDSFILAADLHSGETVWRTRRDELPSWGTPTIYPGPGRTELVTNGSNYVRGYDPTSGKELWRLGGGSKITVPTPIFGDGLIVVASGRSPERPIFAIRSGARGDITPAEDETSSEYVAWSRARRGSYIPTPLIYRGQLYVLNNNGILDSYDLATGEEIYRERIRHAGSGFTASPVAADGKIYLVGEEGDVHVVRAGPEFELLATNQIGELVMASPALSGGRLYIRAHRHLFAIGAP